jgi:tetratricopeptide (TPR) repeat protein
MILVFDSLPRKVLVIALAVVSSAAVCSALWTQLQADRLARRGDPASLERALAFQPDNALLHNRLGRASFFATDQPMTLALSRLERAVHLAPHRADFWIDLALARESAGNLPGAQHALESARRAEPTSPRLRWHQLNFALRAGNAEAALHYGRELLALSPQYTSRVLPMVVRVAGLERILAETVPMNPAALAAALEFCARSEGMEGAAEVWERVRALPQAVEAGFIRLFLERLLARGDAELALRVWQESVTRGWLGAIPPSAADGFFNGDFRLPVQNFGFDWRIEPHPEASVWIDAGGPDAGQQSLCVQFAGEARGAYAHVARFLPLAPGSRYVLSGKMRSDRLISQTGAFIEVARVGGPVEGTVRSEPLTGSTRWREFTLVVEGGTEPGLALLRLRRPAARQADPPATGLVCMSSVEWKPLGAERRAALSLLRANVPGVAQP